MVPEAWLGVQSRQTESLIQVLGQAIILIGENKLMGPFMNSWKFVIFSYSNLHF